MSNSPALPDSPLAVDRLTVASISDQRTYNRGRTLQRKGQLTGLTVRGNRLEATCHDGRRAYGVSAVLPTHAESGLVRVPASCDCRQFYGQCPHIVALLLAWVEHPEQFTAIPTVTEQLAGKSRETLVAIIERMIALAPDLERVIAIPVPDLGTGRPNVASLDPTVVAAEVRAAMHQQAAAFPGFGDLFPEYPEPDAIGDLLDLSREYGDAGLWADVQMILMALATAAMAQSWDAEENEDFLADIILNAAGGLGACLTVQATLPPGDRLDTGQRKPLLRTLYDIWRLDAYDIGGMGLAPVVPATIAGAVTPAERAMVEGWLATEQGGDEFARDATTDFRVALREAAGDTPERMLAIEREAGRWDQVASRLLALNRIDDAIATAREHLKDHESLREFASQLADRGGARVTDAIRLVEDHAWEVKGRDAEADAALEGWLAANYALSGRGREALAIADRRFQEAPGLDTWRAVREIAAQPGQPADAWESRRPAMAARLRELNLVPFLIFAEIEEGRTDAAEEALEELQELQRRSPFLISAWDLHAIEQVLAEAIERVNPDKAIARYREEAERQIGRRTRDAYQVAATSLERVKALLVNLGREAEWQELIDNVRARYPKLRALQEELDALDLA